MQKLMRISCLLLLMVSLVACGFQLRGSYEIPSALNTVRLNATAPNGELARVLRRSLNNAGSVIVTQGEAPELVVSDVEHKRRVLSVNASGDTQEYELLAVASMTISETSSGFSFTSRTFRVRRDYIYESTGVLSSGDQEFQLKLEMERELASQMLRALQNTR